MGVQFFYPEQPLSYAKDAYFTVKSLIIAKFSYAAWQQLCTCEENSYRIPVMNLGKAYDRQFCLFF